MNSEESMLSLTLVLFFHPDEVCQGTPHFLLLLVLLLLDVWNYVLWRCQNLPQLHHQYCHSRSCEQEPIIGNNLQQKKRLHTKYISKGLNSSIKSYSLLEYPCHAHFVSNIANLQFLTIVYHSNCTFCFMLDAGTYQ